MRGPSEIEARANVPALADKQLAARLLGQVSVRTVDRLRTAGELESVVVGERSVRITIESIERYLKSQLQAIEVSRAGVPGETAVSDPFSIPLLADLQAQAAERRATAKAAA